MSDIEIVRIEVTYDSDFTTPWHALLCGENGEMWELHYLDDDFKEFIFDEVKFRFDCEIQKDKNHFVDCAWKLIPKKTMTVDKLLNTYYDITIEPW